MKARSDEDGVVAAVGLQGPTLSMRLDCAEASAIHMRGPWDPSNLAGVPREWLTGIAQEAQAAYAHFGLDPSTRAQAAAHEAGHVVVVRALGETVEGARLMRRLRHGLQVWEGANRYTSPRGSGTATARENPAMVLQCAVHNLAGFVGEEAAGLSHPASAIDERFKARQMCAAVALVLELPAELMMLRVAMYCTGVLHRHQVAFDTIRAHLYRMRRLTRTEAARMLAGVEVLEIETLL